MKLEEIYRPIDLEICNMLDELNTLVEDAGIQSIKKIFSHFLKKPGKHLRPALVFLSAGAMRNKDNDKTEDNLVKLALSLELLHSASLVHDDIIDGDITRRGQTTLNKTYGNKIAVLAGDTLFSQSFATISCFFSKEYSKAVTNLAYVMCMAEIEQARGNLDREKYLSVIKGKTALFMSVCCGLGARLAGGNEEEIKNFEDFGLSLGMAYQIKDDYMDNDPNALKFTNLEEAKKYADSAKKSLSNIHETVYKRSLIGLVDFVMNASYS